MYNYLLVQVGSSKEATIALSVRGPGYVLGRQASWGYGVGPTVTTVARGLHSN